jgi:ABC-type transporter Mla MlaB component
MFKLTQAESNGSSSVTLRLEGRLAGPWVGEVRKACEKIIGEGRKLELDLTDVSFVDNAGVALLSHYQSRGVALADCSPFLREQLKSGLASG